jgi:hypothetical protein
MEPRELGTPDRTRTYNLSLGTGLLSPLSFGGRATRAALLPPVHKGINGTLVGLLVP